MTSKSAVVATKILISAAATAVVIVHLAFPALHIDGVTGFLILLAVLPWLAPIIKSVELPGGFKVELQEVKSATDKITIGQPPSDQEPPGGGGSVALLTSGDEVSQLQLVGRDDPTLAIVGLRIAIERRLRQAAEREGIDSQRRSATWLARKLASAALLPPDFVSGLSDLLAIGNQAAHGAEVSPDAAAYALQAAPEVLRALDQHLARRATA